MPDKDMQQRCNQDAVIAEASKAMKQGYKIIFWVSLPCEPWCQRQQINGAAAASKGLEEKLKFDKALEQEKAVSKTLLRGLLFVLRSLLKKGEIYMVFEWPAYCAGGMSPSWRSLGQFCHAWLCSMAAC